MTTPDWRTKAEKVCSYCGCKASLRVAMSPADGGQGYAVFACRSEGCWKALRCMVRVDFLDDLRACGLLGRHDA